MREITDKVLAIVWKDILSELRTKEIATSLAAFALLVIVVVSFALEPGDQTSSIAAGVLWVAFTFAGVLGLSRSFVLEKDKGCLQGLMLCPVDRGVLYLGKMLSIVITNGRTLFHGCHGIMSPRRVMLISPQRWRASRIT